jgi:hypothetical protein
VVFEDIVTYAGVTYPTQAVGAVEFMSPEYLTDLNFDGYFGLGLDTGNQGKFTECGVLIDQSYCAALLIPYSQTRYSEDVLH